MQEPGYYQQKTSKSEKALLHCQVEEGSDTLEQIEDALQSR